MHFSYLSVFSLLLAQFLEASSTGSRLTAILPSSDSSKAWHNSTGRPALRKEEWELLASTFHSLDVSISSHVHITHKKSCGCPRARHWAKWLAVGRTLLIWFDYLRDHFSCKVKFKKIFLQWKWYYSAINDWYIHVLHYNVMCTLFLDLQVTWLNNTIINKNMQELVPRMGKCVIVSLRHWFSLCILVECNN